MVGRCSHSVLVVPDGPPEPRRMPGGRPAQHDSRTRRTGPGWTYTVRVASSVIALRNGSHSGASQWLGTRNSG